MKNKYAIVLFYLLFIYALPFILLFGLKPIQADIASINTKPISTPTGEKRGIPSYDSIIGKDGWPHFRVFFWVPKEASHFTPYAESFINTDVSEHGPVEKWSVVETGATHKNEKLVFIYVPKTFVYLYGNGFDRVIHLNYE